MAYVPRGQARYGDGEEYVIGAQADPVYNVDEPREKAIVDWRAECFERYGFDALAAGILALRRDVDRAQIEAMIGGGATPEQVIATVL